MFIKSFTFLVALTGVVTTAHPVGALGDDPRVYLHYADSLADEGDFYRAISEYKRVLYFFPSYEKKDWIHLQIGRMYYSGARYDQAKEVLIPLTLTSDGRLLFFTHNFLALTFYENGDFISAHRLFKDLANDSIGNEAFDYGVYEGMALARQKKFTEASSVFDKYSKIAMPSENIKFFEKAKEISLQASHLQEYSRFWATTWAILLPGAGHAYLGQWDNAFVSLSIVLSTALLAYDGFMRESAVQAGIFTTFSTGFYAGSIYSAYSQAGKLNAQLGEREIAGLNKEFRRLTLRLDQAITF